jgi:hypothetical protein
MAVGAVVADGHVEDHAGDVAFDRVARLERVAVGEAVGCFIDRRAAVVEVFVAAGAVDGGVFGAQVVQVGAGAGAGAEVAVGFGPDVFTVPVVGSGAVGGFGLGSSAVEQDDVGWIGGVFVGGLDAVPDLVVGQCGVGADDRVQRRLELRARLALSILVVVVDRGESRGTGCWTRGRRGGRGCRDGEG